LDFKGYVRVQCTEKCKVEFHHACWRSLRDAKRVTADGLESHCFTPDCVGRVDHFLGYDERNEVFVDHVSQKFPHGDKKRKRRLRKPKKVVEEKPPQKKVGNKCEVYVMRSSGYLSSWN
jgi:hypothetical protein